MISSYFFNAKINMKYEWVNIHKKDNCSLIANELFFNGLSSYPEVTGGFSHFMTMNLSGNLTSFTTKWEIARSEEAGAIFLNRAYLKEFHKKFEELSIIFEEFCNLYCTTNFKNLSNQELLEIFANYTDCLSKMSAFIQVYDGASLAQAKSYVKEKLLNDETIFKKVDFSLLPHFSKSQIIKSLDYKKDFSYKENQNLSKLILKKLKAMKIDPLLIEISQFLKEMAYIKSRFEAILEHTEDHLANLLDEIAKRIGINKQELYRTYCIEDIKSFLQNGIKLNPNEREARKKSCAFLFDRGEKHFIVGDAANEAAESILGSRCQIEIAKNTQ